VIPATCLKVSTTHGSETVSDSILDLYLNLISVSRRLVGKSNLSCKILTDWLPSLVLSWVHDDEAIRNEGARWASEVADASTHSRIFSDILDSFSLIISGRTQYSWRWDLWVVQLSDETRRRIISSEPFHVLFSWAGSHPRISEHPAWYNNDTMMDQALEFAHLPADYFRACPGGRAGTTQPPNDPLLPSMLTYSISIRSLRTIEASRPAHPEDIAVHANEPLTQRYGIPFPFRSLHCNDIRRTSTQSVHAHFSSSISENAPLAHDLGTIHHEPGSENSPIGSVTGDADPCLSGSHVVVQVNVAVGESEFSTSNTLEVSTLKPPESSHTSIP
jgi:hypothetical protein